VVLEASKICWVGPRQSLPDRYRNNVGNGVGHHDYADHLILPGFIDAHVHYPQLGVIASFGAQLLQWLEKYTFPEEARFCDAEYAREVAGRFLDLLLANGTTTAAVYCTVHPESVDAFFTEATARGLCMIAGKVLMDRHAPDNILDTAQSGYDDSLRLIGQWHGKQRCHYALTPRFAPTSTPAQLEACSALLQNCPEVFLQTHVAENLAEVRWVSDLFPGARSYLDVYDGFGLLGPRSLLGHAIHMDADDLARAVETGTGFVHCPTSNLFIGSGLFDLGAARDAGVAVLLALCDHESGL